MSRIQIGIIVFFVAALTVFGQVAGRVTGSVVDATGASIPNAKVSLYLPGGATPVLSTQTTSDGLFDFAAVRPDFYRLTVENPGFNTFTQENIKVDPSRVTSLPPIKLEVSTTTQSVEVSAAVQSVDTSTAEVTSTVTQAQVAKLPILDRQVANLIYTQAGVSNSRTVTSVNGLRPSYTNILLDGVLIQDVVRTNAVDFLPNRLTIGQIADMTLASSNVSPTIGGNATVISFSSPSGTNEFHGNAYWYNRNSWFSANDWFNNQAGVNRPFLNLNQLGGSVGGPILKDKLLFYTNYEAYRLRQQTPRKNTILTPNARQGLLTYMVNGQPQTFSVLSAFGLQIDPYIQSLLAKVPTAGNTATLGDQLNTTGYAFNAQTNDTRDQVVGKLDYYLTATQSFSGNFSWMREINDRPDYQGFYSTVPTYYNDNNGKFLSLSWRWNPTPTLTNELRGGFNKTPAVWVSREGTPDFLLGSAYFTLPVNPKLPESRTVDTYVFQDNANWVKGRHTLAFGFQGNLFRNGSVDYTGVVPTYTLGLSKNSVPAGFTAGQIPGASATDIARANNLLATLGGMISGASQAFNITGRDSGFVPLAPRTLNLRMNNYAPYFSDNWKVLRRLTVTLGLRYEYFSPVDERDALLNQPRLIDNNPVATLLGNATLDFAGSAAGRPLYKRDLNNFGPNVGFAWDVFGDGRTAVRGGYSVGFANDNTINSVYNAIVQNNGLSTTITQGNLNDRVAALPSIATPQFQFPTTTLDQFKLSPGSPPVEGLIDPNLATPYVQQWTLGVQHEWKGFVLEGRYVGNHVVKQFRQIDFNQINIKQGSYLQDFIAARNNGMLAYQAGKGFNPTYNPAIAGSRSLPFFDSLPNGGYLTNPLVSNPILTGEAGTLAQTYQTNGIFPGTDPNFSFFSNPYLLYSSMLTNISNSTYNSAQFEVRKRIRNGIQFQANYTFSKALSDAEATRGLEAQLDNSNPKIEKARSPFDLTHAFKLNHYVPLPFGPGRRWNPNNQVLRRVAEGWGMSGFLIIQSGPPLSILSNRGTLNRGARSTNLNTVDTSLTLDQLKGITGLYMTGNGPYLIDPAHVNANGLGVAPDTDKPFSGQVFFNPQPGSVGSLQRRILNGPGFWDYDFSLSKDTKITERQSIEFRADVYNLFNHPNFFGADQNVNASTFGKITSLIATGNRISTRLMQFGLFYRF
jgi:hypothetical protein